MDLIQYQTVAPTRRKHSGTQNKLQRLLLTLASMSKPQRLLLGQTRRKPYLFVCQWLAMAATDGPASYLSVARRAASTKPSPRRHSSAERARPSVDAANTKPREPADRIGRYPKQPALRASSRGVVEPASHPQTTRAQPPAPQPSPAAMRNAEAREASLRAARFRRATWRQEQAAEEEKKVLAQKDYQKRYNTKARKWVSSIIALPIALVTSYYLFDRLALGNAQKILPKTPQADD
ncbi:hypothetical protein G7046_g2671 [Stylonectria norvegica]|nr:hypothetical protein G7046_g2671 [Stylonectria norvegica]